MSFCQVPMSQPFYFAFKNIWPIFFMHTCLQIKTKVWMMKNRTFRQTFFFLWKLNNLWQPEREKTFNLKLSNSNRIPEKVTSEFNGSRYHMVNPTTLNIATAFEDPNITLTVKQSQFLLFKIHLEICKRQFRRE